MLLQLGSTYFDAIPSEVFSSDTPNSLLGEVISQASTNRESALPSWFGEEPRLDSLKSSNMAVSLSRDRPTDAFGSSRQGLLVTRLSRSRTET